MHAHLVFLLASVSALSAATALGAQQTLIGQWSLDETSGTTAMDRSPNANHGTLLNFVTSPAPWGPGKIGGALTFDGIDDYVELPIGKGLPFYDGRGASFSIAMWVRGSPTDDDRVLCLGSSASNTPLFSLGTGAASLSNTDKLRVYARNDANVASARYSNSVVFDGSWHHVVYAETSGQGRLWVDGVRDTASFDDRFNARGTRTRDYGTYTFDKVAIGAVLRPSICCYYMGAVDELQIYGFALTDADIVVVMNGGVVNTCRAGIGELGAGCGPGPLDLYALGSAQLGGGGLWFAMRGGQPAAPVLLGFGVGKVTPLDLQRFGAPGCTLYTPAPTFLGVGALNASGSLLPFPFPVPNIAALACSTVVFQCVTTAPTGVELSNAIVTQLGY